MVGIAIINYKSYKKTIECVESIRKTTNSLFKIYLLENGSNDESAEILFNEYKNSQDVHLIISDVNHGYARGNNLLIECMYKDKCDVGVISNNDIICKNNCIDKLVLDLAESNNNFLLIGPKIINPDNRTQRSVKLKRYNDLEYLCKSTYLSRFFEGAKIRDDKKISGINSLAEVFWVSGAFFAFDVLKMKTIGEFDPKTFLFFEEYILSEKARKMGYKMGYDPQVEVFHYHAVSTGGGLNINSKIAADRSERYYFSEYQSSKYIFLAILKIVRTLEVLYTFGKKRDISSIKKYLVEIKVPLVKEKRRI